MNLKRMFMTLSLICGTGMTLFAAENQKGIAYYKAGLMDPAKEILLDNVKQGNADAQAYYYLGNIYVEEQKADSALLYFKMGAAKDPSSVLNQIGEAGTQLKNNPAAAEKVFETILKDKVQKKNGAVYVAIARAYLPVSKEKTKEYLALAKQVDKKNPDIYIMEGDMLVADKTYGEACGRYEQAIYFDEKCEEAYLKYARIFSQINADVAIERLQHLLEINPLSDIAYRELAEIYYAKGEFDKAKEAYTYFVRNGYSDLKDKARYSVILFFSGDSDEALQVAQDVLDRDPQNRVAQRIQMYVYMEQKNYPAAMGVADQFMKQGGDYLAQDYIYYGRLLTEADQRAEAACAYEKALAADSSKIDVYKDLAAIYSKLGDYENAISNSRHFIEKGEDKVQLTDYFMLGQNYYIAGSDTTVVKEQRLKYLTEADSVFGYVAEKAPQSYLGVFWRARTNASLDPETTQGLAKPYYEKTLEVLNESGNGSKSLLIECYRYLGYYYYLKEDTAKSKEYFQKILELDPTNSIALQAMSAMS